MGRLVRRFATHYIVHSQADKELISKTYGIPEQRISIIPIGLYDHYERVEKAKDLLGIKEKFVILFFGLIRPYKGVKYLIEAFENLSEEILNNSRLLIVGEIWEDKVVVKRIEESKLREKITLVNRYVPDDEVSLYFSASDVLVLPYLRASQSAVAHIGMAFGIPIVATEVGGLKESLSNYEGAYFVEPNAESIAKALEKVYNRRVSFKPPDCLKWEKLAENWIKLIEIICKRDEG